MIGNEYRQEFVYFCMEPRLIQTTRTGPHTSPRQRSGRQTHEYGIGLFLQPACLPEESALAPALAAADIRTWDWDPASSRMRWSARDGVRPGPASYQSFLGQLHPADRQRVVDAIEAALGGGQTLYVEYRSLPEAGTPRWFLLAGSPIRDRQGRVLRMVGICQDITDYHDAIARLRRRELRHSEAEALVHLGSWELDVRTGMAAWSDEEYRLLGYQPGAVRPSYQKFLDAVHPEDRAAMVLEIERALQGEVELYRVEHRVVLADGGERHVLQQGRVSFDAEGRPARLIGTTLDITHRVEAEKALQDSRAQWDHIMDFFQDAVYVLDLDDRIVRANRAFYELTGLTPETALGRSIMDVMHPDGEPVPCPVCQARQRRQDTLVTLEADHPDNRFGRPIEVMVRMIRGSSGEISAVLLALRDLTRTRATEDELRRLNAHIRLLMESAGEGIYGIDREGLCTFINSAALRMLGLEREQVLGRPIQTLIRCGTDGDDAAAVKSLVFSVMASGRGERSEAELLRRSDGECFPVEYSAYPTTEKDRVTGAVVVFRDVTEARELNRKMDYLANHDALTGLVNRHAFEQRLRLALEASSRNASEHVLCYLDLDQFKVVNDTCGHVAGDELLRQLSTLLHERIRHTDMLGRLGGDEFGVLLEDCQTGEALRIAQELARTVQEFRFMWENKTFSLGVSIGLAAIDRSTRDVGTALAQADAACYMAKEAGRNRIHLYQRDDVETAQRHGEMQWVSRLQEALAQDHFCLRYQLIEPTGGAAEGLHFEMLVALCNRGAEMIPPGAFLPAAERYNLMPAIDRWVVNAVLDWLQAGPGVLERLALCSINLSGTSLSDEDFHRFLIHRIRASGVPAQKLCFEITETAAVTNLSAAIRLIRELKQLGCRFALDDFGSGMSSFGYLKELPVDYLKIDGAFVKDILSDPVDRAMVTAICDIGHVMGVRTIAEFVESDAIREVLQEIGVDYVQGYGVAWPQLLPPAGEPL